MDGNLAFIGNETHRRIVSNLLSKYERDRDIIGVLLEGSLARGDAFPRSDVDLRVLLVDGGKQPFHTEIVEGVRLEVRFMDFHHSLSRLQENAMDIYAYLDGRILHDPSGRLAELAQIARSRFAAYRASADDRGRLAYWLTTAREKIVAALDAKDLLKASFIATTSSWQVFEALWIVNDKPVPPAGTLLSHLKDLTLIPGDLDSLLRELLLGTSEDRPAAAINLMTWLVNRL
ncbi:MAG: nucleotidyltransferase domain-containing protein [bacterium]